MELDGRCKVKTSWEIKGMWMVRLKVEEGNVGQAWKFKGHRWDLPFISRLSAVWSCNNFNPLLLKNNLWTMVAGFSPSDSKKALTAVETTVSQVQGAEYNSNDYKALTFAQNLFVEVFYGWSRCRMVWNLIKFSVNF